MTVPSIVSTSDRASRSPSSKTVSAAVGSVRSHTLTDRDAIAARLDSAGIEYELYERPEVNRSQLFVRDPNGILLEVTFDRSA